jgi:uncharacterized phage protein gp47/JayE
MPWTTPSLTDWRKQSRDYVVANLPIRGVLLPNSPMRVMADNSAGLAYQEMLYLAWLADQLLPDTAEAEWLDRHAAIWLPNRGRKPASFASGSATVTGIADTVLPSGSLFTAQAGDGTTLQYQTTADATVSTTPTPVSLRANTAGAAGNLAAGAILALVAGPPGGGVDSSAVVVSMDGGADEETDDELRVRVLARIQKPPMGGDASDYEAWALQVPSPEPGARRSKWARAPSRCAS